MTDIIKALEKCCRTYPLEEKILLTASYADGSEMCQALARSCGGYIHLRAETLSGLARHCLADDLYARQIRLCSIPQERMIMEKIYLVLEENDDLGYFQRQGEGHGLIDALCRTLRELRQCLDTPDQLPLQALLQEKKGLDLQRLWQSYDDHLRSNSLVDEVGLMKMFLSWLDRNPHYITEKIFLLPDFLDLNPLEHKLAAALQVKRIAGGKSSGLLKSRAMEQTDPDLEKRGASQVAPVSPATDPGRFHLFHACGTLNEAKEILRRIYEGKIPLDQVIIGYHDPVYVELLDHLSQRHGFSLTCGEGFSLASTLPGRAASMLLDWFVSDYSLGVLKPLLLEGCIRLPAAAEGGKNDISSLQLLNLLRRAQVGRGRDEYKRLADTGGERESEAGLLSAIDRGRQASSEQRERFRQAGEILLAIIDTFPEKDEVGAISFSHLAGSLAQVLEKAVVTRSERDRAARETISSLLQELTAVSTGYMIPERAAQKMKKLWGNISTGASGSRPGALHMTRFERLLFSDRQHVFITGLEGQIFPGRSAQEPILLDKEREKISRQMRLLGTEGEKRESLMAEFLNTRRQSFTLSYPAHDTLEGRKNHPSSLLLQVLRWQRGDPGLDYSSLGLQLGPVPGYSPGPAGTILDEPEWWITQILYRRTRNLEEILQHHYPGLKQGMLAWRARSGYYVSEFDGQICVNDGELDPRLIAGACTSSSRLEMMAHCPYQYFLSQVLGISPPKENIPGEDRWLDPLQRGSLLHQVFQEFMQGVIEERRRITSATHRERMRQVADQVIGEYRRSITPPSEEVFQQEIKQIYLDCDVFLKCEENDPGRAELLETAFGLGEDPAAAKGVSVIDPLPIVLPGGGHLYLRGIIDRIDRRDDGSYAVWDYKTGSTYGYGQRDYLNQGRQLQHAIYRLAARHILSRKGIAEPRIELSGYYFPTERGEGQKFYRETSDTIILYRTLSLLCDLMAEGQFLAAGDEQVCSFCDYQDVCRYPEAAGKAKKLIQDESVTELEIRRELMGIG